MKILWTFLILSVLMVCSSSYADQSVSQLQHESNANEDRRKNITPYLPAFGYFESDKNTKKSNENAEQRQILNLVAQIGMDRSAQTMTKITQRMAIDTYWMNVATWIAAVFLAATLWLSGKALKESRRVNTLQLQPWVVIKKPKVTLQPDAKLRDEFANLVVEFKIINEGKTPITAAHIHLDMVNATAISVGPFDMGESLITLEGDLVSDTTFQPINQGKSKKIKLIVPCKRTSGDVNAVSFLYGGQLFYEIRAFVKIRDSFTRKGRCRLFYICSSREKGLMSEGRYESRKIHVVTSEYTTYDGGVFNIDRAYSRQSRVQK